MGNKRCMQLKFEWERRGIYYLSSDKYIDDRDLALSKSIGWFTVKELNEIKKVHDDLKRIQGLIESRLDGIE